MQGYVRLLKTGDDGHTYCELRPASEFKTVEGAGIEVDLNRHRKVDHAFEPLPLPSYLEPVEPYEWVEKLHSKISKLYRWFKI